MQSATTYIRSVGSDSMGSVVSAYSYSRLLSELYLVKGLQ